MERHPSINSEISRERRVRDRGRPLDDTCTHLHEVGTLGRVHIETGPVLLVACLEPDLHIVLRLASSTSGNYSVTSTSYNDANSAVSVFDIFLCGLTSSGLIGRV